MEKSVIYRTLKEGIEKESYPILVELLKKIEKDIRSEASYKTTTKKRVSAIKKVASKLEYRPALTGYSIQGEYSVVTDSYHAIFIHQEVMPLSLVITPEEAENIGLDLTEYKRKYGMNSILDYKYPNLDHFKEFSTENEIEIDLDDIEAFSKMNKRDDLYKIGTQTVQIGYLKDIIDVLGSETKVYYQGEFKPIYFINKSNEIGLVLPVKTY